MFRRRVERFGLRSRQSMPVTAHRAGVATPWSGRIGVLDAGTGTFTPREDRADGDRHTTSSSGDSSSSSSSSSSSGSGGVVKQPISSRGAGAEGHLG
jgi:hypothetical protein